MMIGRLGAPASAPAQLQNALRALGTMSGDSTLMKVKVDGIIGPQTVKALNYAIKLVGGFPPYFKTPNMNVTNTKQYAGGIATTITQYIQARGGSVPSVVVAAHHAHASLPPIPTGATTSTDAKKSWLPAEFPRWGWWVIGGVSALVLLNALSLHRAESRAGTSSAPPRRRRHAEAAAEA